MENQIEEATMRGIGHDLAGKRKPAKKPEKPKAKPAPLPEPTARMRARIDEAKGRNAKRSMRPQVGADLVGNVLSLRTPHAEVLGWQETMLDAFGTTSHAFLDREANRIVSDQRSSGTPDAKEMASRLNSALAVIAGVEPKNEIEAMLASQMAATHALAMKELGLTGRADYCAQHDAHGSLALKLLRTFAMQTEALAKLKRGGEQTVRVEHVHVYLGGQAIVGTVSTQQPGSRGHDETGRQTDGTIDARALAFTPSAAVPGEDASRDAVSEGRSPWKEAMPDARRR